METRLHNRVDLASSCNSRRQEALINPWRALWIPSIGASLRRLLRVGATVSVLALLLGPSVIQAQIETEADLQEAVNAGGDIIFETDVEIVLTSPIVISNSVTLDANGNTVTINGDDVTQLFSVAPEVTDVQFIGLAFINGTATNGGAVYIGPNASVTFTNCSFRHNKAAGEDGTDGDAGANADFGIGGNGGRGTSGKPAWGGAIYTEGDLSLLACEFVTNSATGGVGGKGGDGGDGPAAGGNGGNAGDGAAAYGGAVYVTDSGSVAAIDCEFDGNFTIGGDGGAGGAAGNGAFAGRQGIGGAGAPSAGGAIHAVASIQLTNCTFYANGSWGGNSAAGGDDVGIGTDGDKGGNTAGGAVWSAGDDNAFENCTFCANVLRAGDGGDGGPGSYQGGNGGNGGDAFGAGICNSNILLVWNCTVALNSAFGGTNGAAGQGPFTGAAGKKGTAKGAGIANSHGTLSIRGTLLSTNAPGTNIAKISGTIIDEGYNLSSDKTFVLTNSTTTNNVNPKLGVLSTNGGPTKTMSIPSSSPAKDKIPPEFAPDTDQRGMPRPYGAKSDIGAFEYDPAPSVLVGPESQILRQSSTATFSVEAGGEKPLAYQWSFNGTNIAGATASTLTLANIQPAQSGTYSVLIKNSKGSSSATATLYLAPLIVWGEGTVTNVPLTATNLTMIAAGAAHMVALRQNGTVLAWGAGTANAGTEPNFGQAIVPATLTNVDRIAAGDYHSLALRRDGSVVAWGRNDFGQTTVPLTATNVLAVAGGGNHSLAARADGTVVAWGLNSGGQTNVPSGLANVSQVAAGANHSLTLTTNGTVGAWGTNSLGQTSVPPGLSNVKMIAAGANHSLALRSDGSVVAWGDNSFGQSSVPSNLTNAKFIAAGGNHSIAIRSNGTLVVWGERVLSQGSIQKTLPAFWAASGRSFSAALVEGASSDAVPFEDYATVPPFSITPATPGSTNLFDFSSQAGVIYDIQRNNDLSTNNWTTVSSTNGTGSRVAFPMPAGAGATSNSFFRILAR